MAKQRACAQCRKSFKPRKLAKGTSRHCSPKCLAASFKPKPVAAPSVEETIRTVVNAM
jgi:hypothetical protein